MGRRIMCDASEKGVYVVNRCLEKGLKINTIKLEQLLIIINGTMLSLTETPFFSQNVTAHKHALLIKEVDEDFISSAIRFKEKKEEYIVLLDSEQKIIDSVIDKYGALDFFELRRQKTLRCLREICYNADKENDAPNIVPNDLIKKVFDYYAFYDFDIVKEKEDSFQKTLKKQYNK